MAFTDVPPLRWRIIVYEPDGVARGQLPVPLDFSVASPFSELSSMTLSYLNTAPGINMLQAPCEVALEISDASGSYFEPENCRFLNIRQQQDRVQADVTTKLTMPSYGWLLGKARNIRRTSFDDEGNRQFSNVSIGSIFTTMLLETHERANIPFLVADFTSSVDSAGQAWDDFLTLSIPGGQDLLTFLNTMSSQGVCDWRMSGRKLQLYKPDTGMLRDLTTNPNAVNLHTFRDVGAAPDDRSWEDLVSRIMIHGDGEVYALVEQELNPSPWGEWEGFMTQGGVISPGVLTSLGNRLLTLGNGPRSEMTRELMFRDSSPLPFINYKVGDFVWCIDSTGTVDRLRVRQITLTLSADGLKGNVVLGDRFTERDIRIQNTINALSGSATAIGGNGTPGAPTPPKDTRIPKAPTGLVVSSQTTTDPFGSPIGLIGASWNPVTQSTGDSNQDMSGYIVRYAPQGTINYRYARTGADSTSTFLGDGITINTVFSVSVAAIGTNNLQGSYSSVANVLIVGDEEEPPAPSQPVLSTRLGTIRVHWDGRDEDGLNMPADFRRVEVEMGNSGSGPWTGIGNIQSSAGDLIIADQPYNALRWFRFRAVDASGNVSEYSETANIATEALVDTDIIGEVINGANIIDGSLVASDKIVANSITTGLIAALAITAGKIAANAITADKIQAGAVTAEKIQAYSIDATRLTIGGNRNLIVDSDAVDPELGALRIANATGAPQSSGLLQWSHVNNEFYRVKLTAATPTATGRIGWYANSLIDPDLAAGTGTINPMYAYSVDRSMGALFCKFAYNVSLTSGGWPSGATVNMVMYARWVKKDGTMTDLAAVASPSNVVSSTGGWFTYNGPVPVDIPIDAVAVLPYFRVVITNGTTTIQVDHSNVYFGQQNGGVLIEDGAITANKIVANAVTTAKLDADAITAKHTITGALFQTSLSGQRVVIGPNANYLNQSGIRLYSGQAGARDTNIFSAGTTEGGWELGSFGIVGPEATRNSTGRADLNFKVGGGWYINTEWVTDSRYTGVIAPTASNELGLYGSLPRGTEIGDGFGAVRGMVSSFSNGSWTWGNDNGWRYQGSVTPNTTNTTPRYSSISATSSASITWQTSATVDEVYLFLYRGGYV